MDEAGGAESTRAGAGGASPGGEAAGKVLDRLERIRKLSGSAEAGVLLGELRSLVVEAEAWARLEGDERARAAVADLDDALATGEVRPATLSLH